MRNELNVVYSCDNNYFLPLLASVESLMENNKSFDRIICYLLSDMMSKKKVGIIKQTIESYGHRLVVCDVHELLEKNGLKTVDTYPPSTYSRIFIDRLIPSCVDKVLYIDADTIVQDDLIDLWNISMKNYVIAGKAEPEEFRTERGKVLNHNFVKYVNAGILLINVEKWRELNAEKTLLNKFAEDNRKFSFPDQDIISMMLGEHIIDNVSEAYNQFYNVNNFKTAKILHYGGFVARANPREFKNLYNKYLKQTTVGEQKYLVKTNEKRKTDM